MGTPNTRMIEDLRRANFNEAADRLEDYAKRDKAGDLIRTEAPREPDPDIPEAAFYAGYGLATDDRWNGPITAWTYYKSGPGRAILASYIGSAPREATDG